MKQAQTTVHICRCTTRISFKNVFEPCKPGIKNKCERLTQIDRICQVSETTYGTVAKQLKFLLQDTF